MGPPMGSQMTTGPGGTNAVTGVAAAWIEGASCLFLSGQAKRADLMGDTGLILATDLRANALEELIRRVRRAGVGHVHTRVWDGTRERPPDSGFDGEVVDLTSGDLATTTPQAKED